MDAPNSYSRDYLVTSVVLEDAGEFVLEVRARKREQTGGYLLEFLVDPYVPMQVGGSIQGSLNAAAQNDRYQFAGTAGQQVTLQVDADPAGNVAPTFELYDPFGRSVGGNGNSYSRATVAGEYTLESTGLFVVLVKAAGATQTGGYTLHLD